LATTMSAVGMVLALALLALQCGDGYFTAAHFHTPRETLLAAVLGALLCQAVTVAAVTVTAARSLGAAAAFALYGLGATGGRQQEGGPARSLVSVDTVPLTSSVYTSA